MGELSDCDLPPECKISDNLEIVLQARVARSEINSMARQDYNISMVLSSLDIDEGDWDRIGDVLDAGHTGSIDILSFINGVQRIRGKRLRRSDVISVDFMTRDIQENVDKLLLEVKSLRVNTISD